MNLVTYKLLKELDRDGSLPPNFIFGEIKQFTKAKGLIVFRVGLRAENTFSMIQVACEIYARKLKGFIAPFIEEPFTPDCFTVAPCVINNKLELVISGSFYQTEPKANEVLDGFEFISNEEYFSAYEV